MSFRSPRVCKTLKMCFSRETPARDVFAFAIAHKITVYL